MTHRVVVVEAAVVFVVQPECRTAHGRTDCRCTLLLLLPPPCPSFPRRRLAVLCYCREDVDVQRGGSAQGRLRGDLPRSLLLIIGLFGRKGQQALSLARPDRR